MYMIASVSAAGLALTKSTDHDVPIRASRVTRSRGTHQTNQDYRRMVFEFARKDGRTGLPTLAAFAKLTAWKGLLLLPVDAATSLLVLATLCDDTGGAESRLAQGARCMPLSA